LTPPSMKSSLSNFQAEVPPVGFVVVSGLVPSLSSSLSDVETPAMQNGPAVHDRVAIVPSASD